MAALTADMLKTRSGQFDLESIQRVSLSRMALGKVEVLQQCTSLVSLDLSGNMVSRTAHTRRMAHLLGCCCPCFLVSDMTGPVRGC